MTIASADQRTLMADVERALRRPVASDEQTAPLFHYTDALGFLEIVRTGSMWGTHFDHLNDRSELRHGEQVVEEEAKSVAAMLPPSSDGHDLIQEFVRSNHGLRMTEISDVFLASLSEAGDQLSQWRIYGCDGSGFSLGFRSLLPGVRDGVVLMKCEYDADVFRSRIRSKMLDVAEGFEKLLAEKAPGADERKTILRGAWRALFISIASEIPRLKHRSFADEKEWRLVAIPLHERKNDALRFRPTTTALRPYIEIAVAHADGRLDLSTVIVGPGQDADRSLRASRLFLEQQGYDAEKLLQPSEAPYRGRPE